MQKMLILSFGLLIFSSITAQGQSLKELLYSGKLKSDTGSVVRKSDDLSTKIDTSTRKPVALKPDLASTDIPDTIVMVSTEGDTSIVVNNTAVSSNVTSSPTAEVRDNDAIWNDYTEELTAELRREVIPNKKVKAGTYSVLIVYEIETDGDITVNTVSTSPSSSYLEEQVKQRMILSAPKLTPLLNQFGKPRKAVKRQTIVLSK